MNDAISSRIQWKSLKGTATGSAPTTCEARRFFRIQHFSSKVRLGLMNRALTVRLLF
jgi:hypothetical protein